MIRGWQILNRQRQRDSQGKRSLSAEEFVGATVMSTHLARGTGQFGYGGQFTTKVGSMMASVKEAHTGQVLPVDLTPTGSVQQGAMLSAGCHGGG